MPELLNALVVNPQIEGACRSVGMTSQTYFNYLIRSKQGDPKMMVTWNGVTLPFHQAVEATKHLAIQNVEASAMQRAANGCWVPSFFQGAPVWKESDAYARLGFKDDDEARALGFDPAVDRWEWEGDPPRRVQVQTYLKPDTQLVVKLLESWQRKRYGAHQQVDVNIGGVLRLGTTEQKPMEAPMNIIGDDDNANPNDYSNRLALPQPAQSSQEMDAIAAATPDMATVVFQDATGRRTAVTQGPDPLLPQETDTPLQRDLKARAAARTGKPAQPAPPPVVVFGRNDPDGDLDDQAPPLPQQTAPRPAPQAQPIGDGRMGYGNGHVAPGGMRVV